MTQAEFVKRNSHIKTADNWMRLAMSYERDARSMRDKFFRRTNAEDSLGYAAQWRADAERYEQLARWSRDEERIARNSERNNIRG